MKLVTKKGIAMLKYMILVAALCCAGCQSSQIAQSGSSGTSDLAVLPRSEKISVRVEKYVTSYDVEVQRAIRVYSGNGEPDQWNVVSAPRVSGYPEKWRYTEAAINRDGQKSKASYVLNGELVEISLEPGAHLIAKVLPERQNTARVVGIYSHSRLTGHGMEVFSVPFDISCVLGELNVVYLEELDAGPSIVRGGK
jgi:hypothetical protein